MFKEIIVFLIFFLFFSCGQNRSDQSGFQADSVERVEFKDDLFNDSNFTFTSIEHLDEQMLRDTTSKRDYKYIKSIKRFTPEHCKLFNTGCTNTFFDDNVFLVAKQKLIGDILPVIIHDSKDFGYYHSQLFTFDKDNLKIDSVLVSLHGSGTESDEPPVVSIVKIESDFVDDLITTTESKYEKYLDSDSIVMTSSVIFHRKINRDGRIELISKEKVN